MDMERTSLPARGPMPPAGYLPGPAVPSHEEWEEPRLTIHDYLRILFKRRLMATIVFVGIVGAAGTYVVVAPRVYRATAQVRILQPKPTALLPSPILDVVRTPEASLKTESKFVQSSLTAETAARYLQVHGHLQITPREIKKRLKVTIQEPDVLAISVEHTDPEKAALIANAVQNAYMERNLSMAQAEADKTLKWLDEEMPRLKEKADAALLRVKEFRRRYNIKDTETVANLKAQAALQTSTEAERARIELEAARTLLANLKMRLASEKPTRVQFRVVNDPTAEKLREEIAAKEVELGIALGQYEKTHPRVQALQEQLAASKAEFEQRFGKQQHPFRLEPVEEPNPYYETLKEQVKQQEAQVAALQARATSLATAASSRRTDLPSSPEAWVELETLEKELEVHQKAYLALLEKYKETQTIRASKTGAAQVVDIAHAPEIPVRPRPLRTLALAFIVGLGAAVSLALLLEHVDATVDDPDQLTATTGIASLGFIPASSDPNFSTLIALRSPRSPISEGFRSIRSNLKFAHLDAPLRTLVVTSCGAGEGKTFTSTNLAIVFAQAGLKVLLVDTDLRRPSVHRIFGIDHSPGLTNVLAGEISLDEVIHDTELEGLRVIPSGSVPPNPSELLDSQRMAGLLEELKTRADIIIMDTPPALVVTDAIVLSARTDSMVVVVEQGRVSSRALLELRRLVEQARGKIAGAVFNKVKAGLGNYYYYYYYRYYYYYGDGKRVGRGRGQRPLAATSEEPLSLPEGEPKQDA